MCTKALQLAIDIFLKILLEIVDLLEIVALVSGVQLSESVTHIHIATLSFRFFFHIGHYRVLSRFLLVICFVCNSVYMSVPVSVYPFPPSPLVTIFVFYMHDSTSVL